MTRKLLFVSLAAVLACGFSVLNAQQRQEPKVIVEWSLANPPGVQSVEGRPTLVQTALGPTVSFDGVDDGFFLTVNPLDGLEQLTLECIFRPAGDGPKEQRFMHLGTTGQRIMFETRITPDKQWYFDAHTALSNGKSLTLIDPALLHPTDRWYNVTLVWTRTSAATYVNGVPQRWGNLDFLPVNGGVSSIGMRQNKVGWFKGEIYKIRVTGVALSPGDFLKDYEALNAAAAGE
ncbi:MAG: LamG domain-containing protein [Rikenellaceae bacterium]|nr:LamG domain-containing protein [Rikenellaceae bacterium]